MKRQPRILYALLVAAIVLAGILARRLPSVPLFVGDLLWATMIFFMLRFLFIHSNIRLIAIAGLFVCYGVEISQLYQGDWINEIRHTTLGRLTLGQGFLWSDLIAYSAGVFLGLLIERMLKKEPFFKSVLIK